MFYISLLTTPNQLDTCSVKLPLGHLCTRRMDNDFFDNCSNQRSPCVDSRIVPIFADIFLGEPRANVLPHSNSEAVLVQLKACAVQGIPARRGGFLTLLPPLRLARSMRHGRSQQPSTLHARLGWLTTSALQSSVEKNSQQSQIWPSLYRLLNY